MNGKFIFYKINNSLTNQNVYLIVISSLDELKKKTHMQNQWEKNAKSTKIKAFTLAVLIHAVFFTALVAFSSSGTEGGVMDWVKNKMQKEQTEEVASIDKPRS